MRQLEAAVSRKSANLPPSDDTRRQQTKVNQQQTASDDTRADQPTAGIRPVKDDAGSESVRQSPRDPISCAARVRS